MSKRTQNSSSNSADLPLVIVNPRSAGGSTRERWSIIASDLRAHFGPFSVEFTKGPGDGIALAEAAALAGQKLIIACGGDGTINEAANGIILSGEDCELGVFPAGTGGDFRRTLAIPASTRDAARSLRDARTKTIDVGKVTYQNLQDQEESRYFLNVSSFGLATSIIERVKSSSSLNWLPTGFLRGKASFALSALQEVLDLNFMTVRVSIDGAEGSLLNTINFSVANARYFGGGMMIAPEAKLDDGQLDVVNIGDTTTARILLNAHTLYRGTHIELPEVKSAAAKRVEAAPADPSREIHIEVDGELPGKLPAVFEVIPAALKVRVPV